MLRPVTTSTIGSAGASRWSSAANDAAAEASTRIPARASLPIAQRELALGHPDDVVDEGWIRSSA